MLNTKSMIILQGLGTKYRIPSKEFCDKVKSMKKGGNK